MAFRLHHAVAKEKITKKAAETVLTAAYQTKAGLLQGISKTYKPKDEGGEVFPAEEQRVQVQMEEELRKAAAAIIPYWDLTFQREVGNAAAKADIVVEGTTIAKDVPVNMLLFLRKRFDELIVFAGKLPKIADDEEWHWDPAKSVFVTEPQVTHKTAKVQEPLVLAAATEKHPAQAQMVTVDKTIGHWTQIKRSGALQGDRIKKIQQRLFLLREAIVLAIENANQVELENVKLGKAAMDYVFAT